MNRRYLLKRILFFLPTLLGITVINFVIIQLAPGGPVESFLSRMKFSNDGQKSMDNAQSIVSEKVIEEIKKKFDFDKPIHQRYIKWLKNIIQLDFGYSHLHGKPVIDLMISKLPVSLGLGILSFFLIYLICIPLGILKAMYRGSSFDFITSFFIFVLYSIPPFVLAIVLLLLFAGGRYWDIFPLGGIRSLSGEMISFLAKTKDYFWHMALPVVCFSVNHFATVTLLTKTSFVQEIEKDYMRTARAKGLSKVNALFTHGFRNALIPLVPNLSEWLVLFFASSLLVEQTFNLDGFGKLFFDAAMTRDYPVIMAQIFLGAVTLLLSQLLADILYAVIDPRIDFS